MCICVSVKVRLSQSSGILSYFYSCLLVKITHYYTHVNHSTVVYVMQIDIFYLPLLMLM